MGVVITITNIITIINYNNNMLGPDPQCEIPVPDYMFLQPELNVRKPEKYHPKRQNSKQT